ncbi:MAG TPA: imidazole glycerol phosphate synthase subunit HisH [Arenimonas sp.]|nr:imidazole glycerol phosphate synthase subunit HisH [Arenimonas sp.]HOZ03860.1 imidazole glycerol phosphate synthase subunit HisH [Arenimonas sp.]HPW32828.1 imidazole glycerol phosphate synthase subunit HisH [Arenimonas sp.]
MSVRLVLLDSGGSNLGSVQAAFARLGVEASVTSDPAKIRNASHVILPGVGAAGVSMNRLHENGLIDVIPDIQQPLLGICVGMQLLFESSDEGDTQCLGLLPGRVKKLQAQAGIRIPHMGWNNLIVNTTRSLCDGLQNESVYFVHSYAADVSEYTLAQTTHGNKFSSIVQKGNVMGAQFHPERSGKVGARLLKNFLSL